MHGCIRNNNPLKDYFIDYTVCNANRPLIVLREALPISDLQIQVFHNQLPLPLPLKNHSFFHPYIFQPIPPTALHIFNHLRTAKLFTPTLYLLVTYLIFRSQTKQSPVNVPPPTHESPVTLDICRNFCTLLQKSNPARFSDVIFTHLEHLHCFQEKNYKLQQTLTLDREFLIKQQPLITNLKLGEDTFNAFNTHLITTLQSIIPFVIEFQQLTNELQILLKNYLKN